MLTLEQVATAFFVAVVAVVLAVPVVSLVARRVGAIDQPGGRRIHARPIPRLGGIAVMIALVAGITVAVGRSEAIEQLVGLARLRWVGLGAAGFLMLLVGVGDDLRSVRAEWKLIAELAAGVAVVRFFPVQSIDFGLFVIPESMALLSAVVIVLWIATVTNAYNMIDGLDGLAAGVGAIAAGAMAVGAWQAGNDAAAISLVAVAGALTGFLFYNARPARIFLGDAGSLPVGFLLAALGVVGFHEGRVWYAVPAVIALFVPLLDLFTAVIRRFLEAVNVVRHDEVRERFELSLKMPGLFTADGRHIHHRLLSLGLSQRTTVLTLYGLGFVVALLSVASGEWRAVAPVAFVMVVAIVAYTGSRWLYEELQILRRGVLLPLFETDLARDRRLHAMFDFLGFAVAFLGARTLIRLDWGLGLAGGANPILRGVAAGLVCVSVYWLVGVYQISFRRAGQWVLFRATVAVGAATIAAATIDTLVFAERLHWSTWLLTGYVALTFTIVPRLTYRIFDSIHQRSRGEGRRVAVFGAGRGGAMTLRELLENPRAGFKPVAFIDDSPSLWHKVVEGFTVYPGGPRLGETLRELAVDVVAISSSKLSLQRQDALCRVCDDIGVEVRRVQVVMHGPESRELGVGEGAGDGERTIQLVELGS